MKKTYLAEFSGLSVVAIALLACASFTSHPLACAGIGMLLLGHDLDVSFKDEEA